MQGGCVVFGSGLTICPGLQQGCYGLSVAVSGGIM